MGYIPPAASSIRLTLLSWNVANARPSSWAPDPARRSRSAPNLIRDECLLPPLLPLSPSSSGVAPRFSSSPPDVIALQECPYPTFGSDIFGDSGYVSMGTRSSHCGYVDLLVRGGLTTTATTTLDNSDGDDARRPTFTVIPTERHGLPSVAAAIEFPNGAIVAVSSSHLAPFKDGAPHRLVQCAALMSLMSERADDCVLLGDFNARASEDKGLEGSGGGDWIDTWKCTGSRLGDKFTWDSFANRYHSDEGFKFKARFDRCYVRGETLTVTGFGLMGNRPVDGRVGDYLSDHYGLVVGLEVAGYVREEDEVEEEEEEEEDDEKERVEEAGGMMLSPSLGVVQVPTLSMEELRAKRLAALGQLNVHSVEHKRKRSPSEMKQS
jgi:hypothetical protein